MSERFKVAMDIWQRKSTDIDEVNKAFSLALIETREEGEIVTSDPACLLLRNYVAKLMGIAPYTEEEMEELVNEIEQRR